MEAQQEKPKVSKRVIVDDDNPTETKRVSQKAINDEIQVDTNGPEYKQPPQGMEITTNTSWFTNLRERAKE